LICAGVLSSASLVKHVNMPLLDHAFSPPMSPTETGFPIGKWFQGTPPPRFFKFWGLFSPFPPFPSDLPLWVCDTQIPFSWLGYRLDRPIRGIIFYSSRRCAFLYKFLPFSLPPFTPPPSVGHCLHSYFVHIVLGKSLTLPLLAIRDLKGNARIAGPFHPLFFITVLPSRQISLLQIGVGVPHL